jgi:hypothetical protein
MAEPNSSLGNCDVLSWQRKRDGRLGNVGWTVEDRRGFVAERFAGGRFFQFCDSADVWPQAACANLKKLKVARAAETGASDWRERVLLTSGSWFG